MRVSEIKRELNRMDSMAFQLPDGRLVPNHFHVTEVGKITKHFMDCGGNERTEEVVNFQLWEANDYDHRLHPEKLLKIIELSEEKLGMGDLEIEVEYQAGTIGKFGLDFDGKHFLLTVKQTDCLAKDQCGAPSLEPAEAASATDCVPGGGCC